LLLSAEVGFRFIALLSSRLPAYTNETALTFEAQADAYAALLDALHVDRLPCALPLAPSALFCLWGYPQRCWESYYSLLSASLQLIPRIIEYVAEKVMPYTDFIPGC
jgi:hypothetical protein